MASRGRGRGRGVGGRGGGGAAAPAAGAPATPRGSSGSTAPGGDLDVDALQRGLLECCGAVWGAPDPLTKIKQGLAAAVINQAFQEFSQGVFSSVRMGGEHGMAVLWIRATSAGACAVKVRKQLQEEAPGLDWELAGKLKDWISQDKVLQWVRVETVDWVTLDTSAVLAAAARGKQPRTEAQRRRLREALAAMAARANGTPAVLEATTGSAGAAAAAARPASAAAAAAARPASAAAAAAAATPRPSIRSSSRSSSSTSSPLPLSQDLLQCCEVVWAGREPEQVLKRFLAQQMIKEAAGQLDEATAASFRNSINDKPCLLMKATEAGGLLSNECKRRDSLQPGCGWDYAELKVKALVDGEAHREGLLGFLGHGAHKIVTLGVRELKLLAEGEGGWVSGADVHVAAYSASALPAGASPPPATVARASPALSAALSAAPEEEGGEEDVVVRRMQLLCDLIWSDQSDAATAVKRQLAGYILRHGARNRAAAGGSKGGSASPTSWFIPRPIAGQQLKKFQRAHDAGGGAGASTEEQPLKALLQGDGVLELAVVDGGAVVILRRDRLLEGAHWDAFRGEQGMGVGGGVLLLFDLSRLGPTRQGRLGGVGALPLLLPYTRINHPTIQCEEPQPPTQPPIPPIRLPEALSVLQAAIDAQLPLGSPNPHHAAANAIASRIVKLQRNKVQFNAEGYQDCGAHEFCMLLSQTGAAVGRLGLGFGRLGSVGCAGSAWCLPTLPQRQAGGAHQSRPRTPTARLTHHQASCYTP